MLLAFQEPPTLKDVVWAAEEDPPNGPLRSAQGRPAPVTGKSGRQSFRLPPAGSASGSRSCGIHSVARLTRWEKGLQHISSVWPPRGEEGHETYAPFHTSVVEYLTLFKADGRTPRCPLALHVDATVGHQILAAKARSALASAAGAIGVARLAPGAEPNRRLAEAALAEGCSASVLRYALLHQMKAAEADPAAAPLEPHPHPTPARPGLPPPSPAAPMPVAQLPACDHIADLRSLACSLVFYWFHAADDPGCSRLKRQLLQLKIALARQEEEAQRRPGHLDDALWRSRDAHMSPGAGEGLEPDSDDADERRLREDVADGLRWLQGCAPMLLGCPERVFGEALAAPKGSLPARAAAAMLEAAAARLPSVVGLGGDLMGRSRSGGRPLALHADSGSETEAVGGVLAGLDDAGVWRLCEDDRPKTWPSLVRIAYVASIYYVADVCVPKY